MLSLRDLNDWEVKKARIITHHSRKILTARRFIPVQSLDVRRRSCFHGAVMNLIVKLTAIPKVTTERVSFSTVSLKNSAVVDFGVKRTSLEVWWNDVNWSQSINDEPEKRTIDWKSRPRLTTDDARTGLRKVAPETWNRRTSLQRSVSGSFFATVEESVDARTSPRTNVQFYEKPFSLSFTVT